MDEVSTGFVYGDFCYAVVGECERVGIRSVKCLQCATDKEGVTSMDGCSVLVAFFLTAVKFFIWSKNQWN